ncbi:hypothetical protein [Candidatus Thioglobus sp.]|jgi:hypothetical protein|uniref:hypothetical protein n=1 Tax=Candidatus Thioglobus sp. TaxID=2026721 RepID=UPI0017607DBF|nr:hypothetical protein [Candidatus Thioglobus sp.]HIF47419.1 hypothetical protein [Candidatus Thioglobus sp.]HIL03326.1 hypothetical protein [Candidatus Thioglobus autotrophicus]
MDYFQQFKGRFLGVMQLDDCDTLLQTLIQNPDNWYVYDTLETMPSSTISADNFITKINNIKAIIDEDHEERYCGIVYVDDLKKPSFVKIFHPKNLGKTCGSSENPPMPQWLITKEKPMDVIVEFGPKEEPKGFVSKYLKF